MALLFFQKTIFTPLYGLNFVVTNMLVIIFYIDIQFHSKE